MQSALFSRGNIVAFTERGKAVIQAHNTFLRLVCLECLFISI